MAFTMITGATGGLGSAFARESAERGDDLFLTARSEEKLSALCNDLHSLYPKQEFRYFACDLTDSESRQALFAAAQNLPLKRLLNVAGADIQKAFCAYTQEKILFQCRVNFESAVAITHFFLQHCMEKAEVLTVSSISAVYPMPYFALYSATKKAEQQFFCALHCELKNRNIHVTTLLPGAIPTRPDVIEDIRRQGLWGRMAKLAPARVAKIGLDAVRKNKNCVIPGFWNKCMRFFTAPIPLALKMRFIQKRWSKQEKDAF